MSSTRNGQVRTRGKGQPGRARSSRKQKTKAAKIT
jgi:hypothetical protein